MYTLVVLAALTTGGETIDGRGHGGHGGYGYSCGYGGYGYGGYGYSCGYGGYSCGYSACCSPCYSYCYTPCYSYCYTPCYSYSPCYSSYPMYGPGTIVPSKPHEKGKKKGGGEEGEIGAIDSDAKATIVVNVPENATLTVDGSPTTSTSSRRVFVSTDLEPGKNYYYMFKAKVMRDGKPLEAEKKVSVRAGEQTEVTIDVPQESVATR